MRFAAMALIAVAPLSAQDGSDQQLERVRAHMTQTLGQQPNYTCLETVERAAHGPREQSFRAQDTVKLEVALVDHTEMFAWPGSKQFDSTDIRKFVPTGMAGSGEFALYAREVFSGMGASFSYIGESNFERKPVVRYDFRVPAQEGMRIRTGDVTATVGYHGWFFADPASLDVLQLSVIADRLPRSLALREVTDSMDNARVRIGSEDFLLPAATEATMTGVSGDASRNRIRFAACREFTGKSVLKFGDDAQDTSSPAAPDGQAPKQEIQLPKNLTITLGLLGEIDTEKSVVGDPVRAVLDGDVKDKGQVLLPKGTVVTGRLVRLEHHPNFTVLGFVFDDADSDTAHAALNLSFERSSGQLLVFQGARFEIDSPVRPNEGLVPVRPGHMRIGRGIVLFWRT